MSTTSVAPDVAVVQDRSPWVLIRSNVLLFLTVVSIPISYLPYELTSARWPPTYPFFALVVFTGWRAGVLRGLVGPVDVALAALGSWIAVDLAIMGFGTEFSPWTQFTRELLTLFTGLVLFRIAQRSELKPVLVYGLRAALALCGGWGVYQYFVGLPRLLALGYGRGFYFATADGEYRPFGTFLSPTVYGGFLAMLGIAVIATIARTGVMMAVSAAVFAVLLMTETRSAIIGFVVAFLVVITYGHRKRAIRVLVAGVAALYALILYQIWQPPVVASALARLSAATEASDTSSTTRQDLWAAVGHALGAENAWHTGFLSTPFAPTVSPFVGARTAALGHPHSNYFQELYRYGLPGLVLFLALLVTLWFTIRASRGHVPDAMNAAALGGLTVFAIDSIFNNSLSSLNVFAGLLLICGLGCRPTVSRRQ